MSTEFNKNPLAILDTSYTWSDYTLFKKYLRLPTRYLKVLLRNHRNLTDAVFHLPKVVTVYHDQLWGKYKMSHEVTMTERLWHASHLPVTYFTNRPAICEKLKEQEDFDVIADNIKILSDAGTMLYLHSPQMDGAMCAATSIIKRAIGAKLKCFCVSYPNVIEAKKASWEGVDDAISHRLEIADVLLLYAVGSEFEGTGYSTNQLMSIIDDRRINGKMTIIVSGYTPAEFAKRYGRDVDGVPIGFKDNKIMQTLKDLRRSLENGS